VAAADVQSTTTGDAASTSGFSGVALLVDDDDGVRVGVRMVLEVLGFDVLEAHDGRTAIEALTANRDVVVAALVDMTLPGLSGAETLLELRRIRADLPVIVASGREESDTMDRVGLQPNVRFLRKPFGLNELADELKKIMPAR
jgi:two-component system cell cycle sensor histidine kinase/response regulator CckA